MKMRWIVALLCLTNVAAESQNVSTVDDPSAWVNPLMGTDSKPSLSNGNTYPSICVPWGMHYWVPQTGRNGDGWVYRYGADKLRGFKQTHQPSPWMNDYGQFSLMPVSNRRFTEEARESWFSHKAEEVHPYYYSVFLADHGVTTEIAPTERAAQFRFTYSSDSAYLVVDAYDKGSYIHVMPDKQEIVGFSTKNSGGVTKEFHNYFVIHFDRPFTFAKAWRDTTLIDDSLEYTGNHAGALVGFKVAKGEKVAVRVASSFISFEQAELNLSRELGKDSFESTVAKAKAAWNKELGKIKVEGGTTDQVRTFYSCLYRMLQFPQKHYEVDSRGDAVHYSPYNGKVEKGYLFAGTGFWDTFRALYPFLNLMYPSINKEMQAGLVNDYKEGGFLPEWSSPGYRNVMVGNNSAAVVSDAYVKGLKGYDINVLYEALLKDANTEGPLEAVGRAGVSYYKSLGYVPYDVKLNENAARTLEYAFDDFSIYRLGKLLNRPKSELATYARRSMNYKNLFDPKYRLMRGKNKDGSFAEPFNPFKWGDAFTEGNSWHYSWSVFHDIDGLITLMGGRKNFVGMLDSVFKMPPVFDESYYGAVIHEIREMQIMNMGQYAHGNQPIQHMIYLYNYAGEPWKTQYWVREAMNRLYKPTSDGYCGDEDNGQTSAWYVFSAMGFYPVCPSTTQYVLGAPLFKKMTLALDNGKKVVIESPGNNVDNRYVQSLRVNGVVYAKNWIDHNELMKGAVLKFEMGGQPNKSRGVDASAAPYSASKDAEFLRLIMH